MKSHRSYTMAELVVVVLIIGVLAAVAVPLMSAGMDSSKWSEAKAAMDRIAAALRSYAAEKGNFAATVTLADLGIAGNDLDGAYFSHEAYAITSASATDGRVSFVITCTAAKSTRSGTPNNHAWMTLTSNAANGYVATFAEGSQWQSPEQSTRDSARSTAARRAGPGTGLGERRL